jgi:hypothetical protein
VGAITDDREEFFYFFIHLPKSTPRSMSESQPFKAEVIPAENSPPILAQPPLRSSQLLQWHGIYVQQQQQPAWETPVNTFLESIIVSSDQTLFITDHYGGKVIRIDAEGVATTQAIVAGKATSLAFAADESLLLTGME